jgi:hypothetical protein
MPSPGRIAIFMSLLFYQMVLASQGCWRR